MGDWHFLDGLELVGKEVVIGSAAELVVHDSGGEIVDVVKQVWKLFEAEI